MDRSSSPPPPLSGSRDRRRFLLVANTLLLLLGVSLLIISIILLADFLLAHLTFVTAQFTATPILGILAGSLTTAVAAYGLFLWRARREMTVGFRTLGVALAVAFALCVVACILAFLLRETVAHTFSSTKVQSQLRQFGRDKVITSRWNNLQKAYSCCGGGPNGYLDWTGPDGILKEVPDSCCINETPGCGQAPFLSAQAVPPIDQVIFVKGCMVAIKESLNEHVMEMLLACALLALIAALIEVLLMLSVCCFAQHVKKIKDMNRSNHSLDHGSINPVVTAGQPWRKMSSSSSRSGRFDVPQLESSPNMKQSRHSFTGTTTEIITTSSPRHSLIIAKLGHIPENSENGDEESAIAHEQRAGRDSGGRSPAAATGAAVVTETPKEKKRGTFAGLMSWFGKDGDGLGDGLSERRKEKHREDAIDREETLMKVLRNVSAPPATSEMEDEARESADEVATREPRRGFSSFFRSKSKSREEILGSHEGLGPSSKRAREAVRRDRAKSLDALDQKAKEQQQSGWGGFGRWPWFGGGGGAKAAGRDKSSKEEVDGFVEIDLGTPRHTAMSDPELAQHGGARLKAPRWFKQGNQKQEIPASVAYEASSEVKEQVRKGEDHQHQMSGIVIAEVPRAFSDENVNGAKPKYQKRREVDTEEIQEAAMKEAGEIARPTEEGTTHLDGSGGAKLKVPFWSRSRGRLLDQEETEDMAGPQEIEEPEGKMKLQMPRWGRSKSKERGEKTKVAGETLGAAMVGASAAAIASKLKAPSWARSKSRERMEQTAKGDAGQEEKETNETAGAVPTVKSSAREEVELKKKESAVSMQDRPSGQAAVQPQSDDMEEALTKVDEPQSEVRKPARLRTPSWARTSSGDRTVSFQEGKTPQNVEDPQQADLVSDIKENVVKAAQDSDLREADQQRTQRVITPVIPAAPRRKLTLPARSVTDPHAEHLTPVHIPQAPVRPAEPLPQNAAAVARSADLEQVGPEQKGRKLKSPFWAAKPTSSSKERRRSDKVPDREPRRYSRRSKSTSDEPERRFKDPSKVGRKSSTERVREGRVQSRGEESYSNISMADKERETRKSESDLLNKARKLPFRKPTTIGSGEDFLEAPSRPSQEERMQPPQPRKESESSKLKLPTFARAFSPPPSQQPPPRAPKSLPHSLTTPNEELKARRASQMEQQRESSMSPTRMMGATAPDEFDEFNKVRIAGFGVEKLEPKMKASPRPERRSGTEEDSARVWKVVEQTGGEPSHRDEPLRDHDFMNYITPSGGYFIPGMPQQLPQQIIILQTTEDHSSPMAASGGGGEASITSVGKPVSEAHAAMLERRLSDHNFMHFIKQSGYYGHLQMPAPEIGYRKWKEDKVSREVETGSDDNEPILQDVRKTSSAQSAVSAGSSKATQYSPIYQERKRHRRSQGGEEGGRRRSSSESSNDLAEDGKLKRLRQPQFYLNKTDGSILATFESDLPTAGIAGGTSPGDAASLTRTKRGKSHDELRLVESPGGGDDYSLEPELGFLADPSHRAAEEEEETNRRRLRGESRGARAKSEPRSSRGSVGSGGGFSSPFGDDTESLLPPSASQQSRRSKSGDRSRVNKYRKASASASATAAAAQGRTRTPERHMYRTTLEVESVGDGNFDVRSSSSSGGRSQQHISNLRLPPQSPRQQQQQQQQQQEREIPRPPRRHVSVTTMRVGEDQPPGKK